MKRDTVYIVLLNYNNWIDTIECIESLLKLNAENYKIIICDNGSTDDSISRIMKWKDGKEEVTLNKDQVIFSCVSPLTPKPIHVKTINVDYNDELSKINLIPIGENVGFAAGMNVGIKMALKDITCQYVWVLNNDTVVDRDSLSCLCAELEKDSRYGICSSRGLYYDYPHDSQYDIGTSLNKWTCRKHILTSNEIKEYGYKSYYGASFMVTRKFLETVGLMEEKYFLYSEEWDWSTRCLMHGFKIALADMCYTYHKVGRTTKEGKKKGNSYFADFYGVRARILFTLKFYPYCIPTVYIALIASLIKRLTNGKFNRIGLFFKLMIKPNSQWNKDRSIK